MPCLGVFRCPQVVADRLNAGFFWIGGLRKLLGGPELPRCSYGFNEKLSEAKLAELPLRAVLLFEMDGGWNAYGGPDDVAGARHHYPDEAQPPQGLSRVVCVGGSGQMSAYSGIVDLRWAP